MQTHCCCLCADAEGPGGRPYVDVEVREHFPAASSSQDTYTLLKFYNLSKDLVKTVLKVSTFATDDLWLDQAAPGRMSS